MRTATHDTCFRGVKLRYTVNLYKSNLAAIGYIQLVRSGNGLEYRITPERVEDSVILYVDIRRKATLLTLIGQDITLEGNIDIKTNSNCTITHAVLKIKAIHFA